MRTNGWAIILAVGLAAVLATVARAQGGPPLMTDDPGTPAAGEWEINVAFTATLSRREHTYDTPRIDANYGLGDRVQLKMEGPVEVDDPADGPARMGFSSVEWGVKVRFLDEDWPTQVNASIYPQVEVDRRAAPEYVLPVEVSRSFGAFAVNGEAGGTWQGRRPGEWILGLALGNQRSEATELLAEVHATVERATGATETILAAGLRRHVGSVSLLASAGHSITEPAGEPARTVVYVGVSQ